MTISEYISKWDGRFPSNDDFEISAADLREFKDDTALLLGASALSGRTLTELALPMDVVGGGWYLSSTGVWEARSDFNAKAYPTAGSWWRSVASFRADVTAAQISDASAAGRSMLTAGDAATQLGLLDVLDIKAGQHGDHPAFTRAYTGTGLLLFMLQRLMQVQQAVPQAVQAPAAPTGVQVDDTADTMSGVLVSGYPAVADYEVFGSPDFPGIVNASVAGADIQNSRIISRALKGNILVGSAGIRVAANGSRPAGAWMLNDKPFTGVITPPNPVPVGDTVKPDVYFTVPAAGATLAPNSQVLLTATANDNVAVTGLTFTNGATGQVIGQGAKNGSTYTFPYTAGAPGPLSLVVTATDAAGNNQSATVNVTIQAATTTPTPTPALTAALAISVASIMQGNPLTFEVTADGGTAPYGYAVKATNNATGAVTVLGSSAAGSFTPQAAGSYNIDATVTDSAGKTATAITRTVQVTGATQAAVKAEPPTFGYPADWDTTNICTLTSDKYSYTEIRWGIEGEPAQPLASNSTCSPGNFAGRLYAYVVGDSNLQPPRLQSDPTFSRVFSVAASVNNAPTATIEVVGGTSSVAPGQSVTLAASGQDSDIGDQVVKLEVLDNGVKIGELTGASGTLVTPGLSVGSHSFTARATDTKGAIGLSLAVSVTAQAAGTPLVFSPQSGEFFLNLRNDTASAGPGYVYRDAIAPWGIRTNTTNLLVRGKTSFPAQYLNVANLAVFVDGNFFQLLTFTQSNVEQEFAVTGLPAGSKYVQIYEGAPFRGGETGYVQVINLTGVTVPAGFTAVVEKPAKKNIAAVLDCNSRGVGGGVTNGALHAWSRQLGQQLGIDVYIIGYSSRQMGAHMSTASQRQQLVTEAKARLAGYATTYYIQADDENDHAYNAFTPAQLKSFRQELIPLMRNELPNTKLVFQTVLPDRDGNNNPNGSGFTHDDYDVALTETVTGQANAYLLKIKQAGVVAADFSDPAHLGITGENKITAFYLGKLPNLSTADQIAGPVTPPPSGPGYKVVNAESFDSSLTIPSSYSTLAGYNVVASPLTYSAPNVVEVTAIHDLIGIGPLETTTNGQYTAIARLAPVAGTAYWGVRFARQPDGSCYSIAASTITGSTTSFYVFRNSPAGEKELMHSEALGTVYNFYVLTIGRIGARVVATIKRTADNFYLNSQGVFAAGFAHFFNADDPNPLPLVAGVSGFYGYLESDASGQAFFDAAVLEAYV